ncbi:ABC transporter ATP-binding protein [Kaistia adipata]|uniref:ABC transporter ATP-binding protein n=1 Tax=Kaistia adipata TaxID=166954 RepID=UPI00041EEC1B|nr:ABC transporter ATP-binding protein [Kaistia adipata]
MVDVQLRGVQKRWGNFAAIQDLNLEIAHQEFLVLLGPSGCGKTTTMRMIAGLEPVTGGDILIGGERVNDRPARDRDIAMVFQNYGLYPHFTVGENIEYPLKLRNLPADERQRRVRAAAEKVHLEHLLERRPRALSGGQRQRVALARAIVRTPNLFLMDEPLSNLDAILRVSMRAELKRLHHELKTTTIYVTHDQIEAMTLATRVAVMNKGEIVQLGTPEEIYEDPASLFVATFIGSPPMNLIAGTLASGAFSAPGMRLGGFPIQLSGSVTLGIRPDHIDVADPDAADIVGTVYSVEYTGSGMQVTVQLGETRITVMADSGFRPQLDERVGLRIRPGHTFLFDTKSEKRLRF